MSLVVDTGVFSAALSRRRRARFDQYLDLLPGNQLFLAAVTVSELRYGALVASWGDERRSQLDQAIAATTVIPVSDRLLTTAAELRFACRGVGHALASPSHGNDLWIAASAVHLEMSLVTDDKLFQGAPGLVLATA